MQTRHILGTVALALGLAFGPAAFAKEGNATKDDAVATVKKGIAFIKANGFVIGATCAKSENAYQTENDQWHEFF